MPAATDRSDNRRRRIIGALALLAGASACAVTTPRDGTAALQQGGVTSNPSQSDNGGLGPAGTAIPTPGGGGPDSHTAQGATGGAAGGTAGGGTTPGSTGSSSTGGTTGGGGNLPVGVSKNSITISVIAGYSGYLGQVVSQVIDSGWGTWVDDINANGGIYGRKIIMKKVDHQETTAGGVDACKTTQSNGSFTGVIAEGIDAAVSAAGCLDAGGMSVLATEPAPQPSWKHVYLFEDFTTDGQALAKLAVDTLHDGSQKFGVIYLKAADCVAMKDSFVRSVKAAGSQVVDEEAVDPNQASFIAQLQRMKGAGATDVVIIATSEAIGILRDMQSIGYTPHRTLAGAWPNVDEFTEAARNLADGIYAVRGSATTDSPAYAPFAAKAQKYGHSYVGASPMKVYGQALILEQALRKAGPNLTQASFRQAIETISGYDNHIYPPITWSASRHVGIDGAFPVICCHSDYTWRSLGPALNVRN